MNKIFLNIILFFLYFLIYSFLFSQETETNIEQYEKKILFVLEDSKDFYQIAIMDLDGKNKKILTDKGNNWCPSVSPKGDKIAFYSDRSGYVNLWIMDIDGTQQKQLTINNENINIIDLKNRGQISWNPDNEEIYFLKNNDICKIDKNGNSPSNITKTHDITSFKLSPDSKKWIFSREKTKFHNSLWTMNYNTSGLIQITESNIYNPIFDWGINNQIIYTHNRGISLINYDGTNYKIILNLYNLNSDIAWAKFDNNINNNYIAYINNDNNIWIMTLDGKNQKQITSKKGFSPFWLDKETLLYVEEYNINITNIYNLSKKRLTNFYRTYYPLMAEIIKKNNNIKNKGL
ncbi:MAG: hypothetical protein N2114_01910 [Candidatus Goldbacteria bacterium]|nr:hypothetical protein [Candidatus Goldiibacteriota bacterium]